MSCRRIAAWFGRSPRSPLGASPAGGATDDQLARYGPPGPVDFETVGRWGAAVLRGEEEWIHRRVERIYLGPSALLERHISIDFSVPEGATTCGTGTDHRPLAYLPLSVLRKWPPIMILDLRDEQDQPLPLLTTSQNARADAAALIQLARDLVQGAPLSPMLVADLVRITSRDRHTALRALARVLSPSERYRDRALRLRISDDQRFVELASLLVDSAVLWIPIMNEPGRRRVVKVHYRIPAESGLLPLRTLFVQLGWMSSVHWLELPHMGGTVSYHLHVEAQPFMDIIEADLVAEARPGAELPPPLPHVQVRKNYAHLYLADPRAKTQGLAWIRMRVQRIGEIAGAWLAAAGITTLLGVFWQLSDEVVEANLPEAVAILVLVPAVLVGYLGRPIHKLHAQHVLGLMRMLLTTSGAIAIAAAVVAVAATPSQTHRWWGYLFGAACAISGLLTLSLLLPLRPRDGQSRLRRAWRAWRGA